MLIFVVIIAVIITIIAIVLTRKARVGKSAAAAPQGPMRRESIPADRNTNNDRYSNT